MIPLRDHQSSGIFPILTYSLIALNIAVFIFMLSLAPSDLELFINKYAIIPQKISQGKDLYTLFTALFLHGGFAHIIGNMLFLNIFGDNLEAALGKIKFLLYYFVCGLGGSLLQISLAPDSSVPNLGASGAIAGLMGGYLVLFPHHLIDVLFTFGFFWHKATVPAFAILFYWIFFQFIAGLGSLTSLHQGGVAYFAHIGGFLTGVFLIKLLVKKRKRFYLV
jgi:membrane associated rhomboid family serine protease